LYILKRDPIPGSSCILGSGSHLGYSFSTRNSGLRWRHRMGAIYYSIRSVPK